MFACFLVLSKYTPAHDCLNECWGLVQVPQSRMNKTNSDPFDFMGWRWKVPPSATGICCYSRQGEQRQDRVDFARFPAPAMTHHPMAPCTLPRTLLRGGRDPAHLRIRFAALHRGCTYRRHPLLDRAPDPIYQCTIRGQRGWGDPAVNCSTIH